MRLDCGCEFRFDPVEDHLVPVAVIEPCGMGHYVFVLKGVSDLVQALDDVDTYTGRSVLYVRRNAPEVGA